MFPKVRPQVEVIAGHQCQKILNFISSSTLAGLDVCRYAEENFNHVQISSNSWLDGKC